MNNDHILSIDRTKPFNLEGVGLGSLSGTLTIESEDAAALALSSIDFSRVDVVEILDLNWQPAEANKLLAENIAQLKEQDFIFLDAKVMETLLADPKRIPTEWIPKADGDALGTALIEFRGTTFRHSIDGSSELCVLGLSFDRGVWSYGRTETKYNDADLATFSKESSVQLIRYAAVLTPVSTLDQSTREQLIELTGYIFGQLLLKKDLGEVKNSLRAEGWGDIIEDASVLARMALQDRELSEDPVDINMQTTMDNKLKSMQIPQFNK